MGVRIPLGVPKFALEALLAMRAPCKREIYGSIPYEGSKKSDDIGALRLVDGGYSHSCNLSASDFIGEIQAALMMVMVACILGKDVDRVRFSVRAPEHRTVAKRPKASGS